MSGKWHGGKGDSNRVKDVKTYQENREKIDFGKSEGFTKIGNRERKVYK